MTKLFTLLCGFCLLLSPAMAETVFDELTADQEIAAFQVEAVYETDAGAGMGARFRHVPTGFVLDLLRIQSVPQAFMWVNSPPFSDGGEPHTLEHLLLGKGNRGRYVASLEDMALGSSSAYTEQLRTCYHFHTNAGTETFFLLFREKLDAMLNPTFTDEEIRREVMNYGIKIDPTTGDRTLEEKGTVYNEMVSSFERPWGNLWYEMRQNIFGADHEYSRSAGGTPEALRQLPPEAIRRFHDSTHQLWNMGAVAALPNEIAVDDALQLFSDILAAVDPDAGPGEDAATAYDRLPPFRSAEPGAILQTAFKSANPQEPGLMFLAWPPVNRLENNDWMMADLLMELVATGQTSNLHKKLIDSRERVTDIGATSIFGWVDDGPGQSFMIGISDVRPSATSPAMIDSIRGLIVNEFARIASWSDDDPDLAAFNERAMTRLIANERANRMFLNQPPRWGYRGTGSAWLDLLQRLHRTGEFRRSLTRNAEVAFARAQLETEGNIWKAYIDGWQLGQQLPYAGATQPDPGIIQATQDATAARLGAKLATLRETYNATTDDEAIAAFAADYDAQTAILDSIAAENTVPSFIDNPPLTIDPTLAYRIESLPGGGDLVVSTFDNISSATIGLAMDLSVTPESELLYVAALPTLLRQTGVIRDDQPIPFDQFDESVRREIRSLDAYVTTNHRSERAELVVRASGSEIAENRTAIGWLETMLLAPDLRIENLPRIIDAIDRTLSGHRTRMQGSEESWVTEPANAYWRQDNPLLLATSSFMTEAHLLQRFRWQLRAAPDQATGDATSMFMQRLNDLGTLGGDRATASALVKSIADNAADQSSHSLAVDYLALPEAARELVHEAAVDLVANLPGIPDESFADDWALLVTQMMADLRTSPATALANADNVLNRLRNQAAVRGFAITNATEQSALIERVSSIVAKLDDTPIERVKYTRRARVDDRIQQRLDDRTEPLLVGLVNNNTSSGVHIHTADCASFFDSDTSLLLNFLAARLYGGGGAHSMFMRTWGAGLAYSNGLRSNEVNGRLIYYAERCPDLAQTISFVTDVLKNAPTDPALTDYAVSQAFAVMRSGDDFARRGEAMAAYLADGLTDEVVSRFRSGILELRSIDDLATVLFDRMDEVYGTVLPGYGPALTSNRETHNARFFVIGPDAQLDAYTEYLKTVEGNAASVTKLYPRDFWLTDDGRMN